jgi:hypothetical protein
MKSTLRISLVLSLFLNFAGSALGQGTMFFFTSTPQSTIGQGETVTASSTNGFTITAERNSHNGVSIVIVSETRYWFLDFAAPGDAPLVVGQYNNATLWPNPSGGSPMMSFSGEGRVNATSITGNFNVLAIDYGPGNVINRFDADFLQNDGGDPAQANQGMIRFDINPVPEPGTISILFAGVIALFVLNRGRPRSR